jgi:hypothetical protein
MSLRFSYRRCPVQGRIRCDSTADGATARAEARAHRMRGVHPDGQCLVAVTRLSSQNLCDTMQSSSILTCFGRRT